ncbi:hypothetical protein [Symbiopectobacterium purcellii]|uniref:Uncharacterized protein n=1 Tax=Symbiopectobacterium purcellii TaxID=2871826 RepID=A0ABX9ASK3_9ENTR|nr:hypothetical protein [Symbiopectobacterium purcellii]QZN96444.1 hypothetical protein K6K13_02975 [Symbiopectobacterium purcellii]
MSTRKRIREYFKSHDKATYTQIREYCQKHGFLSGNIAFAVNNMMNRGELARTGNAGSYLYSPTELLNGEIATGRPLGAKDKQPRARKSKQVEAVRRFDQLLREVRYSGDYFGRVG